MKSLILSFLLLLASCQSKIQEPPMKGNENSEGAGDSAVKSHQSILDRLTHLQNSIYRIRQNLEVIKRIQSNEELGSIDFVDSFLDSIVYLQDEVYRIKKNKVVRNGEFKIVNSFLTIECQKFSFQIEIEGTSLDSLTYKLKSCYTQSAFLPIIQVSFTDLSRIKIKYDENLFKKILPIEKIGSPLGGCDITYSPFEMDCLSLPVGQTRGMWFQANMRVTNEAKIVFTGNSKKTGKTVLKIEVYVDKNGLPELQSYEERPEHY